jgi:hypothetical protein
VICRCLVNGRRDPSRWDAVSGRCGRCGRRYREVERVVPLEEVHGREVMRGTGHAKDKD